MEVLKIKKGKHDSRFLPLPHIGKKSIKREVIFTESCRYDLKSIDQFDINKLFGMSQLYHHHNSCRFGWRYELETKNISIFSYCYIGSERVYEKLCEVDINETYKYSIEIKNNKYVFTVFDIMHNIKAKYEVPVKYNCNIGYLLEPYFGGNIPAPHDVNIKIGKWT